MPYAPDLVPEGDDVALVRRIEALEAAVRQLGSADLLRTAGVVAERDLLRILGSLQIEGDLSVPNGKIKNDWLESPIERASGVASDENFAIGTSWTDLAVAPIVVPDGYTSSIVTVLGSANVYNQTGSTQYVYLRAVFNRTDIPGIVPWAWGGTQRITVADGFAGSLLAPLIRGTSGMPSGTTLTFYVQVSASAPMVAHSTVWAGTEVQVIFSR